MDELKSLTNDLHYNKLAKLFNLLVITNRIANLFCLIQWIHYLKFLSPSSFE
jgi:hypothetical protein